MNTLLLNRSNWDLCLDASGNIAMASDPYSIAQDVASAVRLFAGELWYDTSKGVPYFSTILGHAPPVQAMKARIVQAAMTVPGVVSATCFISSAKDRAITGQVQVTDASSAKTTVGFSTSPSGNAQTQGPAPLDAFVLGVNTLA